MMIGKRWWRVGAVAAIVFACVAAAARWESENEARVLAREEQADGRFRVDLVSAPYRLDRVYISMTGPRSNQPEIHLSNDAPAQETLWLTGIETEVVAADTLATISPEYFCHSNLTLNPETSSPAAHNAAFASPTHADWRFFTLVPGRMSMHLPPGFGVPVKNGTRLDNFTMALNQNAGHPDQNVRLKTRVFYRRDEADQTMRPLFRRALYVYQQHKPQTGEKLAVLKTAGHQGAECAESCQKEQLGLKPSTFANRPLDPLDTHPGATCCVENASLEGVVTQFGAENTVHWMVPPGEHVYRSEVTKQFNLPGDTRVHYVTGHLHPFGRTLKLIDLESGETVFDIRGESQTGELGVKFISEISSAAGIPVSAGRRYELVTEYNNPTKAPIDAMAILYLYAAEP